MTPMNYPIRFGAIPLMLFSGTFFPVSQLPGWIRPLAYATPLWHGVALCRGAQPRHADPGLGRHPRRLPGRAGGHRAVVRRAAPTAGGSMSRPARAAEPPGATGVARECQRGDGHGSPAPVPDLRSRSPPSRGARAAADRAARAVLPAAVAGGRVGGGRAAVLPAVGRGRASAALIGTVTGPGGQPVPYREFVAPGLLAVSALNGALNDSTFNIYGRLKFEKLYDAVLATPLGARDVAFAEIGWAVLRGMIYSVSFLIVMAAMGLIASPWAILALPGAGADQLRHRRDRGVPHHLHEVLAGLRLRDAGRGAAVPVLRHVLSAIGVPARHRGDRGVVAAVPGRGDPARPGARRCRRPTWSGGPRTWSRSASLGLALAGQRIAQIAAGLSTVYA